MSKEKKVKVAVQMDKLNKINKDTDSTLALIQEAIKRRFSVFIYNVDNLYFDLNCLIHPQCYLVIKENPNWNNRIHLEKLMIKQIKKYMLEWMEDLIIMIE